MAEFPPLPDGSEEQLALGRLTRIGRATIRPTEARTRQGRRRRLKPCTSTSHAPAAKAIADLIRAPVGEHRDQELGPERHVVTYGPALQLSPSIVEADAPLPRDRLPEAPVVRDG